MYQPYTYRIKFILTGQEYYGVRHGKKANPEELWKSYFTSSNTVNSLISKHGRDSFEVVSIKLHGTKEEATAWEELFLTSVNAGSSEHWLNRTNGGKNFCTDVSPEARKLASEKSKNYYANNPDACKASRDRFSKFNAEHPEFRKEQGRRLQEYFAENPSAIASRAKTLREFYLNNKEAQEIRRRIANDLWSKPDERARASRTLKAIWADPANREERARKIKTFYENNPEACEARSKRGKAWLADPINKVRTRLAAATGFAKKAGRPFSYIPKVK